MKKFYLGLLFVQFCINIFFPTYLHASEADSQEQALTSQTLRIIIQNAAPDVEVFLYIVTYRPFGGTAEFVNTWTDQTGSAVVDFQLPSIFQNGSVSAGYTIAEGSYLSNEVTFLQNTPFVIIENFLFLGRFDNPNNSD